MLINQTFIDRLKALGDRIKNSFTLCGFMGKTEREVLVTQTIHAAVVNLEKHGEPFSFRDNSVFVDSPHADNAASYRYLRDNGYFVEEERQGRVVIFPTERLLTMLEGFFDRE